MQNVFFSIVTPVYNGEKYIEECILSLKEQYGVKYEHIIMDGGSTDKTMDIIKKYEKSYPVKVVSEKDKGMYDAINKGFMMARGNVLAWLNADDKYMPWTLKMAEKVFENTKAQWITGIPAVNVEKNDDIRMQYIMADSPFVYCRSYLKAGFYEGRMLGFIQQESTFFTKELWEKAGGKIPDNYQYAGDYFLWKSFAKYEPLYTVNSILANFRVHGSQKTSQMDKYYEEIGKKTIKYKLLRRPLRASLSLYAVFNHKRKLIDVRRFI